MLWRKPWFEYLREVLRFGVYTCLIANGILASLFSVWFVWHFLRQLMKWCRRVLFGSEW